MARVRQFRFRFLERRRMVRRPQSGGCMSKSRRAGSLKRYLRARQAKIIRRIEQRERSASERDVGRMASFPDDIDVDSYAPSEEALAERDVDSLLIEQRFIERAMQRLEQDGSITCVDCSAEIPARRVIAVPSVQRCVRCQEKFEARQSVSRREDRIAYA
ncbi:MAG: TraR/DksA C4-type zinc finger protein [Candidatus Uhrbacteria bacterium]